MNLIPIETVARTAGLDSTAIYAPAGDSASEPSTSFGDHFYRQDDAGAVRQKAVAEDRLPDEPRDSAASDSLPAAGPAAPVPASQDRPLERVDGAEEEPTNAEVPAAGQDQPTSETAANQSRWGKEPREGKSPREKPIKTRAAATDVALTTDSVQEVNEAPAAATSPVPQETAAIGDQNSTPGRDAVAEALLEGVDQSDTSASAKELAVATSTGPATTPSTHLDAVTPVSAASQSDTASPVETRAPSAREAKKQRVERRDRPHEGDPTTRESSADVATVPARQAIVAPKAATGTLEGAVDQEGTTRPAGKRTVAETMQITEVQPRDSVPVAGREADAASASPRLAQHLVGKGDERSARGGMQAEVDTSRFLDRVTRAFRSAESREGVVKLRLHPPELGSLRVELQVQNGALTARLEAETTAAQTLLIDHAQALRDRLAEQGIRVERFDVGLLDQHTPDHSGTNHHRASTDGSPGRQGQRPAAPPNSMAHEPPSTPSVRAAPGQLNVIV